MIRMNMLFGALFKPRSTFAKLAEGLKWAWVPAVLVLLAASLANVAVTVPLATDAQIELGKKEQARIEKEMAAQGGGPVTVEGKSGAVVTTSESGGSTEEVVVAESGPPQGEEASIRALALTAGLVFGAVGVIASLLAASTFFFVAGKVWAKRVVFGTFVSMTALAAMPLALRDLLQTAYQAITGTWIQHQGISSLVAEDALSQGRVAYGLLAQVDVWSLWALVLLYVGVRAAAGFERKRALIALAVFAGVTIVLRAAPTVVTSLLMGVAG